MTSSEDRRYFASPRRDSSLLTLQESETRRYLVVWARKFTRHHRSTSAGVRVVNKVQQRLTDSDSNVRADAIDFAKAFNARERKKPAVRHRAISALAEVCAAAVAAGAGGKRPAVDVAKVYRFAPR
eukprot:gene5248-3433_t